MVLRFTKKKGGKSTLKRRILNTQIAWLDLYREVLRLRPNNVSLSKLSALTQQRLDNLVRQKSKEHDKVMRLKAEFRRAGGTDAEVQTAWIKYLASRPSPVDSD